MLKRKNKSGYVSESDNTENESSFTSKPRSIISITKQNSYKSGNFQTKTPSYRGHPRISFQQDPNFMKLIPRDIPVDKERLIDDNLAFKSQTSLIIEENSRLKSRLFELQNEQNNEISNNKVHKMKNKIRDLQSDLQKKEEDLLKLKKNLKSCKISEKQNEIDSYINEASKLAYLLERLFDQQNPLNYEEFDNETVSVGYELQALRKENIDLNQLLNQTTNELNIFRSKLVALDKKAKKQNSKTLLKKLRAELLELEKTVFENKNSYESIQKSF